MQNQNILKIDFACKSRRPLPTICIRSIFISRSILLQVYNCSCLLRSQLDYRINSKCKLFDSFGTIVVKYVGTLAGSVRNSVELVHTNNYILYYYVVVVGSIPTHEEAK